MRNLAKQQSGQPRLQTRAEKTAFLIERKYPDYDSFMQEEVGDLDRASKGIDADSIKTMAGYCLLLADCRWEGAKLAVPDDKSDTEMDLVGPVDLKAFEDLLADVMALYNELKMLSAEQLDARFETEMDDCRPFSRPESAADFEEWLAMPSWTPDEATALSFGKDPKHVQLERLQNYAASPFANSYRQRFDRLEQISRSIDNGIQPKNFYKIARDENIDLPEELADELLRLPARTYHLATRKLQDLLLAMAIKHYNLSLSWDCEDEKTEAIAAMGRAIANMNYGLEATDKTLRDHLKPAMKRLRARIRRPLAGKSTTTT